MNQNKIDEDHHKARFVDATTTGEFLAVETKFTNVWKAELLYSIDRFSEVLLPEDREVLSMLHQRWEEENGSSFDFEASLLDGTRYEYGKTKGSAFVWLFASQVRESYRRRTIKIKYLHYLLEKGELSTGREDPEAYASLKFKYCEGL